MMSKVPRPFFVIESLDAGGGSTQLNFLTRRLKREGFTSHQYHFPQADAPTGQLIYQKYLHDKHQHPLSKREQALLYIQDFYSRLLEMEAIVTKGTKKDVVISDRYCTSTMAYQTVGLKGKQRAAMLDWLRWLAWEGTPQLLQPTAVILLDIPVDLAIHRLATSGRKRDIHEQRDILTAVRASYMRLAEEAQWIVVNNVDQAGKERTRQNIHEEVWGHISSRL